MKKIKLFLIMLFYSAAAFSQQWQSIGKFNSAVSFIQADDTSNILYLSGYFKFINKDTIPGICYWDGHAFNKMGCGFDNDCYIYASGQSIQPTASLVKYKGLIYAIGVFTKAGGVIVNCIAAWNGLNWSAIGSGLKLSGGDVGIGEGAQIYNNELYVYGLFDSVNGIEAHGLAKFDGTTWSAVNDFPLYETTGSSNRVEAICFYNGELYVGGNFQNFPTGSVIDLVKWDGTKWVGVGGLTEPCEVGSLTVFNNELYVAGDIGEYAGGANGNNIIRFDGTNWKDVGGGVNGEVDEEVIHNGKMYIVGGFHSVGDNLPANCVARWDGKQWCSFNSVFDNKVLSLGFYKDTMYIGGGFEKINGDSISYLARWISTDSLFPCTTLTGIKEVSSDNLPLSIYPNPTSNIINLSNLPAQSSTLQYSIINILGQTKQGNSLSPNNTSASINVSGLPAGVYFLRLTDSKGVVYSGKFVKE